MKPFARCRLPGIVAALLLVGAASAAFAQEAPLVIAEREVRLETPRLRFAEGTVHAVLSFTRIPADEDRSRLTDLGVTLHDYLPDLAFIATVPAGKADALLALEFVVAGEPLRPEWKGPPGLREHPQRHLRNLPDGDLLAHVYFHPDVPLSEALSTLALAGIRVRQGEYGIRERLRCEGSADAFRELLARDAVAWVETAHRERRATNAVAALVHGADTVASAPYDLDGTGVRIGVMDVDYVQHDHTEFGGRVTLVDKIGSVADFHSTHVTGTILGDGSLDADARGMAPGAKSWNWTFEEGDLVQKKATGFPLYGIEVDNNSWGSSPGWQRGPNGWLWYGNTDFGAYLAEVGDLDGVARDSGTLIMFAAGNDGTDDGYDGFGYYYQCFYGYYGYYCDYYSGHYDVDPGSGYTSFHSGYHPPDGGVNRFGNIGPESSMKNGICVAAMDSYLEIADFSSAGPAKDGRMKPDCAAVGVGVWSTVPTNSHDHSDGTSMSTPVVTGISALLVEAWKRSHDGIAPPLDVLKGLLLHSCVDLGASGPDFRFGFGGVSAPYGASLALNEDGSGAPYLRTGTVQNGQVRTFLVNVAGGTSALRATLCWIDPPGNPSAQKALVNDLDLEMTSPSGVKILPWKLNASDPKAVATRGLNRLDTVEQAETPSPETGTWTVKVRGYLVPAGSQGFALWLSSPRANLPPVADAGPDLLVSASGPAGVSVNLSAAGSSDPDEDDSLVSFQWDLDGDGKYDDATGSIVTTFLSVGGHVVAVRVTDAHGASSSDEASVVVRNDPPVASLGGDRTLRANDPEGVSLVLDTTKSSDLQGPSDLVGIDWDLDGDGEFDDAEGSTVPLRLPVGTSEIGLRLTDTAGGTSEDRASITVIAAEYLMRLGGTLKGALDHSAGEDRDSVFFEAAAGGVLDVKVKGSFPYRLTVYRPGGSAAYEHDWVPSDGRLSVKGISLSETGWYWMEIASRGSLITSNYALAFKVRPASGRFTASASLGPFQPEGTHEFPVLAGTRISARVKGSGISLSLRDAAGSLLAADTGKGAIPGTVVPATGIVKLVVTKVGTGVTPYDLLWKLKPPREKARIKE